MLQSIGGKYSLSIILVLKWNLLHNFNPNFTWESRGTVEVPLHPNRASVPNAFPSNSKPASWPPPSIFFWFFATRNAGPTTAPLTIWINGGPGSYLMIGLFEENRRRGVDINGNVYSNLYSWIDASNMLYIGQPTQVGFSYVILVNGFVDPAS
jgi:hypothetical protein